MLRCGSIQIIVRNLTAIDAQGQSAGSSSHHQRRKVSIMSKELRISLVMIAALMLRGVADSARAGSPTLNGGFNVLGSRLNVPVPPKPPIAGSCALCKQ
jgi:hypothetical protein